MRFPSEWPPQSQWERFPNWERVPRAAGAAAQDEKVVRPAVDQTRITAAIDWTAGEARLPDGQFLEVYIELRGGKAAGGVVFSRPANRWALSFLRDPDRWVMLVDDPLYADEQDATIGLGDLLPSRLMIRSRLPVAATGAPLDFAFCAHFDFGSSR